MTVLDALVRKRKRAAILVDVKIHVTEESFEARLRDKAKKESETKEWRHKRVTRRRSCVCRQAKVREGVDSSSRSSSQALLFSNTG